MSATRIAVDVQADLVSIRVGDLLTATPKVTDVLDVAALRFSLSVPIRTTGVAAALDRRLRSDIGAVIDATRLDVDRQLVTLAEALRTLLEQRETADAPARAGKLITAAEAEIDRAVDGLPPAVRAAIGKIASSGEFRRCFAKQMLTTAGTWGFARSRGLRAREGLLASGRQEDDGGERLWRDLQSVRSRARAFVLLAGGELGLAIGGGSADVARARALAGGGGSPLHGEVCLTGGTYQFQLDAASSRGKRDKLARQVRERIRALCRKSVAVRFDDDDKDEAEDKS